MDVASERATLARRGAVQENGVFYYTDSECLLPYVAPT